MRLRKAERDALANLLEQGADTPEDLVDDFVKLLDELRGARSHFYAAAIVAGIPLSIGPYATKAQAKKAIEKFGADLVDSASESTGPGGDGTSPRRKVWIVPGWTEEGWVAHLKKVDAKPEPAKLNAAEQRKRDSLFWQKARPLMDGEADGLVLKPRDDVWVKPFKTPKGVW